MLDCGGASLLIVGALALGEADSAEVGVAPIPSVVSASSSFSAPHALVSVSENSPNTIEFVLDTVLGVATTQPVV